MTVSLAGPASLGRAIRAATVDFYENSWRLVPANLAWTGVLLAALIVGGPTPLGLLLVPLVALPTAGLFAMAARLARAEPIGLGDFGRGIRATWRAALLVGAGAVAAVLVLTTNLLIGLGANTPLGWFVAATALWGEVGLGLGLLAAWPILADPRRATLPIRRRLRLAVLVVLLRPLRIVGLALFTIALLAASTILLAALLTIAVAYLALVASRVVLPLADALEPAPGSSEAGSPPPDQAEP